MFWERDARGLPARLRDDLLRQALTEVRNRGVRGGVGNRRFGQTFSRA